VLEPLYRHMSPSEREQLVDDFLEINCRLFDIHNEIYQMAVHRTLRHGRWLEKHHPPGMTAPRRNSLDPSASKSLFKQRLEDKLGHCSEELDELAFPPLAESRLDSLGGSPFGRLCKALYEATLHCLRELHTKVPLRLLLVDELREAVEICLQHESQSFRPDVEAALKLAVKEHRAVLWNGKWVKDTNLEQKCTRLLDVTLEAVELHLLQMPDAAPSKMRNMVVEWLSTDSVIKTRARLYQAARHFSRAFRETIDAERHHFDLGPNISDKEAVGLLQSVTCHAFKLRMDESAAGGDERDGNQGQDDSAEEKKNSNADSQLGELPAQVLKAFDELVEESTTGTWLPNDAEHVNPVLQLAHQPSDAHPEDQKQASCPRFV